MENKQHVQLPNNMTVNEKLKPKDLLVYVTIKKYMNSETLSCFPSLSTIVEKSGVSKPTVLNAIKNLEKHGYLKVTRNGRSNLYTFSKHKNFEPYSSILGDESITVTHSNVKYKIKSISVIRKNGKPLFYELAMDLL